VPSTEPLATRLSAGRRLRVYVSSPALDLAGARAHVIDVIRRSGCEAVSMEMYGADTRQPIERCLHDVRTCEIYVGIVAWRYGSCPPDSPKSFTHLEYEEAVRHRKHVLVFHLDESAPWTVAHVDSSKAKVRRLRRSRSRCAVAARRSSTPPPDRARRCRRFPRRPPPASPIRPPTCPLPTSSTR
jgi:hypothetical protein